MIYHVVTQTNWKAAIAQESSVNEEFPHIYGQLNLDAVIKIEEIN